MPPHAKESEIYTYLSIQPNAAVNGVKKCREIAEKSRLKLSAVYDKVDFRELSVSAFNPLQKTRV